MTAVELLGAVLRSARETLGLSPEQAAQAAGLAGNTVRRLEAAKVSRPRTVTLDRLADFYGLRAPLLRSLARLGPLDGEDLLVELRERADAAGTGFRQDVEGDVGSEGLGLAMRLARRPREAEVESFAGWATARHPGLRPEDLDQLRGAMEHLIALDRVRRRLAVLLIDELRGAQMASRPGVL